MVSSPSFCLCSMTSSLRFQAGLEAFTAISIVFGNGAPEERRDEGRKSCVSSSWEMSGTRHKQYSLYCCAFYVCVKSPTISILSRRIFYCCVDDLDCRIICRRRCRRQCSPPFFRFVNYDNLGILGRWLVLFIVVYAITSA